MTNNTREVKSDILVLGATGFTGRLITRYLSAHPQRHKFSLALGARSKDKLQILFKELSLPKSVHPVEVDVTRPEDVEQAVKGTKVVINAVGPYWRWGTPVVRACVRHGVHYVDLTGETVWIKEIIREFDYYATKTGSIIVPSCGFDSIPSDITAFLSNKTLKSISTSLQHSNGHAAPLYAGKSTTAHKIRGGISGGTLSTMMMYIEDVPSQKKRESSQPYAISPIIGEKPPRPQFIYELRVPDAEPIVGGFLIMQPSNKAIVQRTFGLLELQAITEEASQTSTRNNAQPSSAQLARYGPQFNYDEFVAMPGRLSSFALTSALILGVSLLALVQPIRWLLKHFITQPGGGPSDKDMQEGFLISTNITISTSTPPVQVETILKGNGDPGYLLTAVMISESALCLLLPPASVSPEKAANYDPISMLPHYGRQGGVLTPMTAFGDILIHRLEETGRFEFNSGIVGDKPKKEV